MFEDEVFKRGRVGRNDQEEKEGLRITTLQGPRTRVLTGPRIREEVGMSGSEYRKFIVHIRLSRV